MRSRSSSESDSARDGDNRESGESSRSGESHGSSVSSDHEAMEERLLDAEGKVVVKSIEEFSSFGDDEEDEGDKEACTTLVKLMCRNEITAQPDHTIDFYRPSKDLFSIPEDEELTCQFFNYKHLDAVSRTFLSFADRDDEHDFKLKLKFNQGIKCKVSRAHKDGGQPESWIHVEIENDDDPDSFASKYHRLSVLRYTRAEELIYAMKNELDAISRRVRVALGRLSEAALLGHDADAIQATIVDLQSKKEKLKKKIEGSDKNGTGWKIHVSVDDTDPASMLNAWNILLYCAIKHQMPEFKVKSLTSCDKSDLNLYIGDCDTQLGKTFAIFLGPHALVETHVDQIKGFLIEVQEKFLDCKVIPGCQLRADDHILSHYTPYFYYRNDSDSDGFYYEGMGDGSAFNPGGDKDPFSDPDAHFGAFLPVVPASITSLPITTYYNKALFYAAFYGDKESVCRLICNNADVNEKHAHFHLPLIRVTPLLITSDDEVKEILQQLSAVEVINTDAVEVINTDDAVVRAMLLDPDVSERIIASIATSDVTLFRRERESYMTSHRHENAYIQRAYDNQFALCNQ